MTRSSLKYVLFKDRKEAAADLKKIYTSPSEETTVEELDNFATKPIKDWGPALNQFAILYGQGVPL